MKIKYYGTGAGTGTPSIFCSCKCCVEAREKGGKEIRTRLQAVVNDELGIEYPVDTFLHTAMYGLDMRKVTNILVSHNHYDHFLQQDVMSRYQGMKVPVRFYMSEASGAPLKGAIERLEELYNTGKKVRTSDFRAEVVDLKHFEPTKILDYTVIPLPAHHAKNVDSMIFIIQKGDKSMLWGHDTGEFPSETAEFIKSSGIVFDLVSLDCTLARGKRITKAHMDIDQCAKMRDFLLENGNLREGAKVVLSHISHIQEKTHDEMVAEAEELGMIASYDGMEIEF